MLPGASEHHFHNIGKLLDSKICRIRINPSGSLKTAIIPLNFWNDWDICDAAFIGASREFQLA
jgi:hypothetical protein